MKTYAVFPGLEALFQTSRNIQWLELPKVVQACREVSGYLAARTGQHEDIALFLRRNVRPHLADLDRAFVAHTAIQVGIWRQVADSVRIDGVVGCSVGDLARVYVSGSLGLEETVDLVWYCTLHRQQCPPGRMANVRPAKGPFTEEQLAWLRGCGISVSVWSDRHAAVAGPQEGVDALVAPGARLGLKVRQIYDYPFHSPVMTPLAQAMASQASRWKVADSLLPVYSSVWLRHIASPGEIRLEAVAGVCEPVRWKEAVDDLHAGQQVGRLLNIGPTATLTSWIPESSRYEGLEVVDAWDLANAA